MEKWMRARHTPCLPLDGACRVTASEAHVALSREAAAQGMVLLKNENNLLPLAPGARAALFGKGSFDYVKGGGGSGDVTVAFTRNLYEGLQAGGVSLYEPLADFYRAFVAQRRAAGDAPGLMAEPALPEALLADARKNADVAILVFSRFSGEGWDRVPARGEAADGDSEWDFSARAGRLFPRGDFYLSDGERALADAVCASFDRVAVVLNTGGVMDVSWCRDDARISSLLLAWQGGMDGGGAAAALLTGRENPCGRLPDTFAYSLADYPSTAHFEDSDDFVDYTEDIYVGYRYFETLPGAAQRVCYPFGFGLSYTSFAQEVLEAGAQSGRVALTVRVRNTGTRAGREVVQVYFGAPAGLLQKPARCLAAFGKTRLLAPGESETLSLGFDAADMASFDDLGKIARSAWVLEAGRYTLYVGANVRDAQSVAFAFEQPETAVVRVCSDSLAPSGLRERLCADGRFEALPAAPAYSRENVLSPLTDRETEGIAPAVRAVPRRYLFGPNCAGARPLDEVAGGRMTLDEFLAQLKDDELCHLLGGQPNTGVANTFNIGDLPDYGVPSIATADGPAGLRIQPECGVCTTAWPCATLLASTWDEALVARVGAAAADELRENNIGVWLAPAVNIHRSPLCGRNFEYYSEEPLLAGRLAGAMVRGIQSRGVAATVKHFACNNKETNRKDSDSRVSRRALREIYLRVFEIIVRDAQPWAIMSSYNLINGQRTSESKELLTDILRGDWGYQGLVMTDWWTHGEHYLETCAGNDLKMACGFPERLQEAMARSALTRADVYACARRVLSLILNFAYFEQAGNSAAAPQQASDCANV